MAEQKKHAVVLGGAAVRYKSIATPIIAKLALAYALIIAALYFAQAFGERSSALVSGAEQYAHISTWQASAAGSFLLGFLMLFLATQLRLRKRAALFVLFGFIALQAVVDGFRGLNHAVGAASIAFGFVFLLALGEFPARPDPASLKRFKVAFPALVVTFLTFGVTGLHLVRGNVGLAGSGVYALAYRSVTVAVGGSGLAFHGWGAFYRDAVVVFFFLGCTYLAVLLFRPYREQLQRRPEDVRLASSLVEHYGCGTLSYFTLRGGKNLFFLGDEIFLAYKCVGGTAIVSSDPVGPPELIPEIISRFRDYCEERGWRLGGLAAAEEHIDAYREAGMKALYLGDEAVVDLAGFTLEGRRVRKLRQSVSKLDKIGVTMEFMYNASIPGNLRHGLAQISSDWRGDKPETGFSMGLGRLLGSDDPDCLLAMAYDADSKPIGFLYLAPMYPHLGYSLDITRTMIGAPNALSEYMLARTALFLKESGYHYMSLHFLAFCDHYREDRPEPGSPFWRAVSKLLDGFLPIISVYNFDKKFLPRWERRYIVHESIFDLPRVGMASIIAESALKVAKPGDRKRRSEALQAARN